MFARIYRPFGNTYKSKRVKLVKEIEEQLKKFAVHDISEIGEYYEVFKEKNFEISLNKKSSNIILRKNTELGAVRVFFRALEPDEYDEGYRRVLNPEESPQMNEAIDMLRSQGKRFSPLDFRVGIERDGLVQVFECNTLAGDMSVKSTYITESEGFVVNDYEGTRDLYKPCFDYSKKRCLGINYTVLLKNAVLDRAVLDGMVKISEFHYVFLCNRWMEKVKKVVS